MKLHFEPDLPYQLAAKLITARNIDDLMAREKLPSLRSTPSGSLSRIGRPYSSRKTTHHFYLAVRDDHLKRARAVTAQAMASHFGTRLARAQDSEETKLTQPMGKRYDRGA